MEIAKETVASVTYALTVDGELIEQTDKTNPLVFLAGVGQMIPGFENQLFGKKAGEEYSITVQPAEAYGDINPEAVVTLPKDIFQGEGFDPATMLQVGAVIPMQDNNGNPMNGTIVEIADENVKMDFNHQLAGKTLQFAGEVVEVREATSEELDHGHVHGPGGHQH